MCIATIAGCQRYLIGDTDFFTATCAYVQTKIDKIIYMYSTVNVVPTERRTKNFMKSDRKKCSFICTLYSIDGHKLLYLVNLWPCCTVILYHILHTRQPCALIEKNTKK